MGREQAEDGFLLARLTAKQREALDLLIEHKTSKEIGRRLGISPHTVDQRIRFAREKLGAVSRSEAATIYRRLSKIYGRSIYEDSYIAQPAESAEEGDGTQAGPSPGLRYRGRSQLGRPAIAEADYRVVPELFEGRYGTLVRLGAIITLAVALVILVLGGLAILSQLSELMAN